MMHLIRSYAKFLWNSKNEYSVHSPFVFDLLTKCFYDRTNFEDYKMLSDFRSGLLRDKTTIKITDFGAGSRVFKSNERKICEIARNAGITRNRALLLYRIARYLKPSTVLELGTSLGLATSALSQGNPRSKITTLEGCPETASAAKRGFEKFGLKNIDIKTGEFDSILSSSDFRLSTFDLIYFDGNHQKDATLRYFNQLLETATNDSVWIFDDIHWSAEMSEAWETIKSHPKVRVTIDTFQWGIVFFRTEQPKEHFVIRT